MGLNSLGIHVGKIWMGGEGCTVKKILQFKPTVYVINYTFKNAIASNFSNILYCIFPYAFRFMLLQIKHIFYSVKGLKN